MRAYALVVHNWGLSGGVPRVGRFFRDVALGLGYRVTVFDLPTSSQDPHGVNLVKPRTWRPVSPKLMSTGPPPVYIAGVPGVELEPMRYLQSRELRKMLRNFDIVQVVGGSPAWALAARDLPSTPVALQVATRVRWERAGIRATAGGFRGAYRKAMVPIVDRLETLGATVPDVTFVENENMLNWMRHHSRVGSQVLKIPPGIDTERFSPNPLGWQRDGPIISVGRLSETRKGWDRLLMCYHHLLTRRPHAPDLLIVGSGVLSSETRNLLDELALGSRVKVRSNVSLVELVALLQKASVFVTTSYEEGLGLAALEGMAAGLPVVACLTDGSSEYVKDRTTGRLLSQDDTHISQEFTEAVLEVLSDHSGRLSNNARSMCVENFSRTNSASRVADVYRQLV